MWFCFYITLFPISNAIDCCIFLLCVEKVVPAIYEIHLHVFQKAIPDHPKSTDFTPNYDLIWYPIFLLSFSVYIAILHWNHIDHIRLSMEYCSITLVKYKKAFLWQASLASPHFWCPFIWLLWIALPKALLTEPDKLLARLLEVLHYTVTESSHGILTSGRYQTAVLDSGLISAWCQDNP